MILSHKHRINIWQKIGYCRKSTDGCFCSFVLSSAYRASVFSEIDPVPLFFFHLKSFLWKGPRTVKVRKKIMIRFWSISVSVLKYGYIYEYINIKKWTKHKVKSYIYCVNHFLCEKRHNKWNHKCKQKQSLLFNFCNSFDLLYSGVEKMAWWPHVFKTDFYIFSCNEKFKEI